MLPTLANGLPHRWELLTCQIVGWNIVGSASSLSAILSTLARNIRIPISLLAFLIVAGRLNPAPSRLRSSSRGTRMQATREEQLTGISRRGLIGSAARAAAGALVASPAIVSRAALGASAFPRTTWPQAKPGAVGMSTAKLLEAKAAAKRYGVGAGCVIRHGLVVFRWGDFDQRFLVQSATKSWGSALLGLALDAGKFTLRDKVRNHLPNLGAKPTSNVSTGWLDDITFEQLATHTGGFPNRADTRTPGQAGDNLYLQQLWRELARQRVDESVSSGSPSPRLGPPVPPNVAVGH